MPRKKKKRTRLSTLNSQPSPLLKVRKSGVHGRGVFATKTIRKGARIIEYTGRRISWKSVPPESDEQCTYYFGLDNGKEVIDPAVGGNEARWINHSCDPNCEAIENEQERVFIHALRSLRPGEELFYDYELVIDAPRTREVEEEAKCFCGSARCRGTMLEKV
jgi:uncharacterized protein